MEVLLYLSLSMIMLVVLAAIGVDVLEGRTKVEMEENAVRNAQHVYETVRYTLADVRGVVYPEPGNSSSTLQVVVGDSEQPVSIWVEDERVVMLDVWGNVSYLTDYTSRASLQFTNLVQEPGGVRIQIDVLASHERGLHFEQASTTLSTTVGLR